MTAKPVVVGVDGSEESLRAVEWAAMEATRRSRSLRIVSAPAVMPRLREPHASEAEVGVALRGVAARALDAAVGRCAEVAPGLPVETRLVSGPPALAVVASGREASMLVVGSRGAGGFAAMVLGSVSRYAASHAPCPVVVARQETVAVHRAVAVGVRDPDDAVGALGFAFEEAALRGADLVAVHAWFWFPPAMSVSVQAGAVRPLPDRAEQVSAEAARALEETLDLWRDKYPGVLVRQDVVRGHPGRVLAGYSARADLVVLGRHGSPDKTGAAVGSVRHAVLDHAHGPVAVVPQSVAAPGEPGRPGLWPPPGEP
jgi:nucleotide-binding universal stress UspA family protein